MTEIQVGSRVRIAASVLPEGGPQFPEGAEGTVTLGPSVNPRFPDAGEFVGVEWDDPEIANGAVLARRLERVAPRTSGRFARIDLPGLTVAEAAEGAQRLSEALSSDRGVVVPLVLSEAESVAETDSQGAFPEGSRVLVRTLGLFAVVTDYLPPSGDTLYVALDGDDCPDPTLVNVADLTRARVYVSGPMTGLPEFNFPAFDAEADRLRLEGWEVENPADKGIVDEWTWEDYLRYDVRVMADCHAIFTLPNWHTSPGANLEMMVAQSLGMTWLNPDGKIADMGVLSERVPSLSEPNEASVSGDATIGNAGEVRVVSTSGGEKGSKLARFDLIPAGPLWTVAEHYGKGAEKYEDRNWERGYDWHLSFAAMQRHAWAFWNGEDVDPETGSPHMAAVVFHALALMQFMEKNREFDNRPGVDA